MENTQCLTIKRAGCKQLSNLQEILPLINNRSNKLGNLKPLVEKVLIARLVTGDKSAFSLVYSAYYKDLVMFAASFTHDQDIAEEITQDIFVKLWEDHESVKINQSLKSYLLTIVRNKCIDWHRHNIIKQTYADNVLGGLPYFECDTDNYLLFSELQEQLDIALNKLPDEISGPFRMNRNQGLRYYEIAEILGVSVRTIEVRIGKALHMLRNYLKDYFVTIIILFNPFL